MIQVSRKSTVNHFTIRTPMWKDRTVGLADNKLGLLNAIDIIYQDKSGNRTFPDTYFITRSKAQTYPLMSVGRKVLLRQVPIADLEILDWVE